MREIFKMAVDILRVNSKKSRLADSRNYVKRCTRQKRGHITAT